MLSFCLFFPSLFLGGGLEGGVAAFHPCLTSTAPNIKAYLFIPEASHSFVQQTQGLTASMPTAWLMNTNCWGNFWPRSFWIWGALPLMKGLLLWKRADKARFSFLRWGAHLTLKIHFLSFCEHLIAPAASCTAGVVMFVTCLQEKR